MAFCGRSAIRARWNVSTRCRLPIGDTAECHSALRSSGQIPCGNRHEMFPHEAHPFSRAVRGIHARHAARTPPRKTTVVSRAFIAHCSPEPCSGVSVSAVGESDGPRPTLQSERFMGRANLQGLDADRCHEPLEIPLIRPSGTFSPTGGEGWDEGVRFMGRGCLRCLWSFADECATVGP
jgi:hypothetical protein